MYFELRNENLPIYGVPSKNLKDFATSKKDVKKGVEIPLEEQYRLLQEDVYHPKAKSDFGMKGPGDASHSSSISSSTTASSLGSGGHQFGEEFSADGTSREASRTLYAKKGDIKVTL